MKLLLDHNLGNILSLSIITVTLSLASALNNNTRNSKNTKTKRNLFTDSTRVPPSTTPKQDLKYILQWLSSNDEPLIMGQQAFIDRKCLHTNCFITSRRPCSETATDKPLLDNYTKYDVIVFGPDLSSLTKTSLPQRRSPHQKYAFLSSEPSDRFPLPSHQFDGYFNWTWTYHLDSDLRWGSPFVVRNNAGDIVGPNTDMHWLNQDDMSPAPYKTKRVVDGKRRTAAWFVSNCKTLSKRENNALQLRHILFRKYKLHLDIYGQCGQLKCPKEKREECDEFIERKYFFYMAYEKSLSEDFVSDQLLHAVKYNTIPIVYGGTNYTRFLPEGSYLNARTMTTEMLAAKINELVRDINKYLTYFKWRNHYSYHRTEDTSETDGYCRMCALLNNEKKVKETSIHDNFSSWWFKFKKSFIRDEHERTVVKRSMDNQVVPPIGLNPGFTSLIDRTYKKMKSMFLYAFGVQESEI